MTAETKAPRVLVAEDDAAIRRLLAMTLRRRRLDVGVASDGGEALERLQQEPWTVVVMDLMMPQVNGWEIIRWLGDHPEHRPQSVIVVSAADRSALHDLDPRVVNAIVFKPFDVVHLAAYVKSAAQQHGHDRRHRRIVRTI